MTYFRKLLNRLYIFSRNLFTLLMNLFLKQLTRALEELRYTWVVVWVMNTDVKEGTELAQRRSIFKKYTANLQLVADWWVVYFSLTFPGCL